MATYPERDAIATVIISLMLLLNEKRKRRKRSIWVKPWLPRQKSTERRGIYINLIRGFRLEDEA